MRILGIDPGIAIVGYGIIEYHKGKLLPLQYGSIQTPPDLTVPARLNQIYLGMQEILERYRPDVMAVEKLFFNRNTTTAFSVGQARGVTLLAAEQAGLEIYEYTPLQVKQTVVGYGKAEKKQMEVMVKALLSLKETPKPDDVADALAVAITHAHLGEWQKRLKEWR